LFLLLHTTVSVAYPLFPPQRKKAKELTRLGKARPLKTAKPGDEPIFSLELGKELAFLKARVSK
jgi:hypothetical protein